MAFLKGVNVPGFFWVLFIALLGASTYRVQYGEIAFFIVLVIISFNLILQGKVFVFNVRDIIFYMQERFLQLYLISPTDYETEI